MESCYGYKSDMTAPGIAPWTKCSRGQEKCDVLFV